jgi:hypothetical protein
MSRYQSRTINHTCKFTLSLNICKIWLNNFKYIGILAQLSKEAISLEEVMLCVQEVRDHIPMNVVNMSLL